MNMRRRDFVVGAVGAAAWPTPDRIQRPDRMQRIGLLLLFAPGDPQVRVRELAFGQQLRELGWIEGHNVQFEYRYAAGDVDRMRVHAKDLVDLESDVIVTHAIPAITAIREYTRVLPIVFAFMTDPVEAGLMKSVSHPDDNVTGFTSIEYSILGKWLQLLKEIAPRIGRVGLMYNPHAAYNHGSHWLRPFEAAAPSLALKPIGVPVHSLAEVQDALATLGRGLDGGLILVTEIFTSAHYAQIVTLATEYHVPACCPFSYWTKEGGLMSFGPSAPDVFRRAASYVDQILKGTKPSVLPLQQPNKFELVINLRTAKALGLTVRPSLLARADEVIE